MKKYVNFIVWRSRYKQTQSSLVASRLVLRQGFRGPELKIWPEDGFLGTFATPTFATPSS